jgi:hypothetical protein
MAAVGGAGGGAGGEDVTIEFKLEKLPEPGKEIIYKKEDKEHYWISAAYDRLSWAETGPVKFSYIYVHSVLDDPSVEGKSVKVGLNTRIINSKTLKIPTSDPYGCSLPEIKIGDTIKVELKGIYTEEKYNLRASEIKITVRGTTFTLTEHEYVGNRITRHKCSQSGGYRRRSKRTTSRKSSRRSHRSTRKRYTKK